MLTSFLHRIASYPAMYVLIQRFAGHEVVDENMRRSMDRVSTEQQLSILDVGGGTGKGGRLWSREASYICLEIDPLKLAAIANNSAKGNGVLADATKIPFGNGVFDVVVCCLVAHHISDMRLPFLLQDL